MSKEKKYAVIVVLIGVVSILLIYHFAMRNPNLPASSQPILPGQNRVERPNHPADKPPSQSRADITPNKTEYPVTPSQTLSIPEIPPSSVSEKIEQEKLLYTKALGILKPKKAMTEQTNDYVGYEIDLTGVGKEVDINKLWNAGVRPNDMPTIYQENCEEAIKNLEELIQQYPDSAHIQHYQETLTLLKQMLQEDKEFPFVALHGGICITPPVQYKHSKVPPPPEVSPEEQVRTYIHYLRKECLLNKIQGSFKMRYDALPSIFTDAFDFPSTKTRPFGKKIVEIGNIGFPELVKLLDDRRLITVDDEITSIPARFYRYQDAAVGILQTMFSPEGNKINPKLPLAKKSFPVEIPVGEYFSEYLEKQTPEGRQKVINDIKLWVEEALNNPLKSEDLTPESEGGK